jgi:RNA-directed DNA polymerase
MHEIWLWCRTVRHEPMEWQRQRLASRLLGYYNYFGITSNYDALVQLFRGVRQAWRYWLGRRSQRAKITWTEFSDLEQLFPLPKPRVVHSWV